MDEEIDFYNTEQRFTIHHPMKVKQRENTKEPPKGSNSFLEMRITEISQGPQNRTKLVLDFRFQFFPSDDKSTYILYATYTINTIDYNDVLRKNLNSDLGVGYISAFYKDGSERMYKNFNDQWVNMTGNPLHSNYEIDKLLAEKSTEYCIKLYLSEKSQTNYLVYYIDYLPSLGSQSFLLILLY